MSARFRYLVLLIVLVALTVAGGGCVNSFARSKAEHEIARRLPTVLGPAASYQVQVDGTARRLMRGELSRVHIVGLDVRPKGIVPLERLEVTVEDLHVDLKNSVVKSSGPATWSGWINNAELTRMMANGLPYLQDVTVSVRKGVIVASGKAAFRGIGPSATVNAVPAVKDGDQIWLTPVKVEALGLGMGLPGWGRNEASRIVNPVFVLPHNGMGLVLKHIEAEPGLLRLDGTFNPVALGSHLTQMSKNQ